MVVFLDQTVHVRRRVLAHIRDDHVQVTGRNDVPQRILDLSPLGEDPRRRIVDELGRRTLVARAQTLWADP